MTQPVDEITGQVADGPSSNSGTSVKAQIMLGHFSKLDITHLVQASENVILS